jgi:hypothetical protein
MLDQLVHNPRRIFLMDSIGAMLSAFLLGGVLTNFEDSFGMPRLQLYFLALIAVLFAVYSMVCHLLAGARWKPLLKVIAIANLAYCGLTMGLVIFFFERLTPLGIAYFVGELVVIGVLVGMELWVVVAGLGK